MDLNCDLGEGEPTLMTGALMGCVTSANIACGGHAGTRRSMRRCLDLARELGVHAGAHPGLPGKFGRGDATPDADDFRTLLLEQLGHFDRMARARDVEFHHVKLHGTLYHATERDEDLRITFLSVVRGRWPGVIVYALTGGETIRLARIMGLQAWDEAFADRGYRDDGSLVPRGEPGALIGDPVVVADRVKRLAARLPIPTVTGGQLTLRARTVCLHGDTAGSVAIARAIRAALAR
jgi:5-oxoprolinase (ATP-hydrolysing) subunit A